MRFRSSLIMQKLLIAAALGCVVALPVMAKVYELPDANPAVTVTLPNSWKPSDYENAVE